MNVVRTSLSAKERELILRVARCKMIGRTHRENDHPCHAVVGSQGVTDGLDRQVPEAWAGNLGESRVVFLSSNPSISEADAGMPVDTAEAYPAGLVFR